MLQQPMYDLRVEQTGFALDLAALSNVADSALISAHQKFQTIGALGLEALGTNQHGDTSLRLDVEAEECVIQVLRLSGLPLRVIAEEHGKIDLVEKPTLLAFIDGIDGTREYKRDPVNGRFGTLLSIYNGESPSFGDYLYGGMLVHSENILYNAARGTGACAQKVRTGDTVTRAPISLSAHHSLDNAAIFYDASFTVNQEMLVKLGRENSAVPSYSSTLSYAALVKGASELIVECTRKGNLELCAIFPILSEAGGEMRTVLGDSLAEKSVALKSYLPVLIAANPQIAQAALNEIRARP